MGGGLRGGFFLENVWRSVVEGCRVKWIEKAAEKGGEG
jgi:hypothetical protein